MSDVRIRVAEPADVPAVHALVEGAYRGDSARRGWTHEADLLGGQRTDLAALEAVLADPGQALLVAERGGRLVGCVRVGDEGGGTAQLGLLAVEPGLQGGGLGRALVAAAEAHAVEHGAGRMEMTVIDGRAELIAWYERRGYGLTGERRPFPMGDPRFGLPRRTDLVFVVLTKALGSGTVG